MEEEFVAAAGSQGRQLVRLGLGAYATSRQRVKQRLGFHKIRGVEALGEPSVSLTEQLPGFFPSALRVPQTTQARGRAQLPRLCALAAGSRLR